MKARKQGNGLRAIANFPSNDERRRIVSHLLESWTAELAAARDSLIGPDAAADLARFPEARAFAHFISPRRLVDALKKSRLGQRAAARDAAGEMLMECIAFLAALGEKTVG
jgi:hypothetical protein